ncbi:uncharacterized protein zgc:194930 [Lampris incognitus]|uniref:uncharacterized protein zgc:194930 n=1 Tax=Lampris incognitus TaxID=2546036 RepID=UPI0024B519C9|nr:uncharacterized protein zgc:194930 [Lampris incognitus]
MYEGLQRSYYSNTEKLLSTAGQMGCKCCRMIKSYIYDPTITVDGRKSDSSGGSLYQPHLVSGEAPSSHNKPMHGFHNLGYSKSNDGTLKLEVDNNQVNRLHAAHAVPQRELHRQASIPPADGGLYIIQPAAPEPKWMMQKTGPSQVPIYPNTQEYVCPSPYDHPDGMCNYPNGGQRMTRSSWESSLDVGGRSGSDSLSVDEIDEGVGGTPEYPCDTGDEGSILSGDIHTSTTSMSSADTRDDRQGLKTPDVSTVESGISVTKSEDEEEEERDNEVEEEVRSVTDSMVAEALAALEAATAGEDCE